MTLKMKFKIVKSIVLFSVSFFYLIYKLDKNIMPTIMAVAEAEMRIKAIEIINEATLKECSENFNYDDIIKYEKDRDGNIIMLRANTIKLNKIASNVALDTQNKLKQISAYPSKIPMGYMLNNNILATLGPDVSVRIRPIGYIETKYHSIFESSGVNQTIHKIYMETSTQVAVVAPFVNNTITIKREIPICETVIVGKVPHTNLDMNLKGVKYNTN